MKEYLLTVGEEIHILPSGVEGILCGAKLNGLGRASFHQHNVLEEATCKDCLAAYAARKIAGPTRWLSLHTGDPDRGGGQQTYEETYAGYTRQVFKQSRINFPQCTNGRQNWITHYAIGVAEEGQGMMLFCGKLHPIMSVSMGVTPSLKVTIAGMLHEEGV